MSLSHQIILGIPITTTPREKILEDLQKSLFDSPNASDRKRRNSKTPIVIATPNPEQIVMSRVSIALKELLNRADVTLPDGIGLVWALRFLSKSAEPSESVQNPKRIAGVDFMTDLVRLAAKRGVRIGLIGSRDGLAVKALECLRIEHPKLSGWAADGPEIPPSEIGDLTYLGDTYWDGVTAKIRSSDARMLFVGLGAPKQEAYIGYLQKLLTETPLTHPIVLMSVGGSFELIAGVIPRAPLIIRSMGFEWLWRLFKEPWRWRRQLALLTFIRLVVAEKFRA